jgi:drug/metabolite transporter (DMT)-like permease
MIVGMAFIPLGDSAGKLLVSHHNVTPGFVAWSRFALGALILLPFLRGSNPKLRTFLDWRLILRGSFVVGGILCMLIALETEPLPNVFGAFFVGPLLSYVLSAWLLGEPITTRRSILLVVGFLGVLLIVKPGFGLTTGLATAALGGVFYACYLVASRWLSDEAAPRLLLATQLVTGSVLLAPLGLTALPSWSNAIIALTLLSAAASMTGNLLLVLAYRLAPATRLAPFVYFQLIAAMSLDG